MIVDFTVVLPELIVAMTAIIVMLADLYLPRVARPLIPWLALAGLGVALLDTLIQHADSKSGFSGSVVIDGFSLFSAGVFTVVGILVVLMSMDYLGVEHINFGEYYVLLLGTVSGMMLMSAANSLIVIFLAL